MKSILRIDFVERAKINKNLKFHIILQKIIIDTEYFKKLIRVFFIFFLIF